MEIPGHLFGVAIGLVNQTTLAPVGTTVSYKMRKAVWKGAINPFRTGHNMNAGFDSAEAALRKATITLSNLVDSVQNLIDLSFALREGLKIRVALTYLASAGAGTGIVLGGDPNYLCPGCLILDGTWSPDAEAGQPFDLVCETIIPYSTPGETAVSFTF